MKCAEQVRNVYGQVQMWKAIYRYIISTNMFLSSVLRLFQASWCVKIRGAGRSPRSRSSRRGSARASESWVRTLRTRERGDAFRNYAWNLCCRFKCQTKVEGGNQMSAVEQRSRNSLQKDPIVSSPCSPRQHFKHAPHKDLNFYLSRYFIFKFTSAARTIFRKRTDCPVGGCQ